MIACDADGNLKNPTENTSPAERAQSGPLSGVPRREFKTADDASTEPGQAPNSGSLSPRIGKSDGPPYPR